MRQQFPLLFLLVICGIGSSSAASSNGDGGRRRRKTIRGNAVPDSRGLQQQELGIRKEPSGAANKKSLKISKGAGVTLPTLRPSRDPDGSTRECSDDPEFTYVAVLHGGDRLDCGMFASIGSPQMCDEYGDIVDVNGLTAKGACCFCGGRDNGADDTCFNDPDFTRIGPVSASGFILDCEAFGRPDLLNICEKDGDRIDRNGLTANQACCGCGGSDNGIDDRCVDDPDFESSGILSGGRLMTCQAFEDVLNLCDAFGDLTDINGISANQACCICGGSDDGVTTKCVDDPDFTDVGSPSFGEIMNCDAFAKYDNLCADFGGSRRDTNGLIANEACCACGGGDNGIDDKCDDNTDFFILQPDGIPNIDCRSFVYEGRCEAYGDWKDPNGLTANEECCACTKRP